MIPTPTICQYRPDRKTVQLYFDDRTYNAEYYVRGGIRWPEEVITEAGPDVQGYACVGALNVKTGKMFLFSETTFKCIDHYFQDGTNHIELVGLCQWLGDVRVRYCCDTFFYREQPEQHRVWIMQVSKSVMIVPKPHFVEVHADDDQMRNALVTWIGTDRLIYNMGGAFHKALERYDASVQSGKPMFLPPIRAAQNLVVGLDRHPWRAR
jgi:hypothetical protein